MPAILNLSPSEIVIALVVAIVVFGRRLPEVAGQVAGALQKMRRSMDELRRETGIDREIRAAQRAVQEAVPRNLDSIASLGQEGPPPRIQAPPARVESEDSGAHAAGSPGAEGQGDEGPQGRSEVAEGPRDG